MSEKAYAKPILLDRPSRLNGSFGRLFGGIVSSTSYDSFGNATSSQATASAASSTGNAASNIATTYRYTGREYDADTGLYYYRNRWYDPETGRFISEDPIGFAGGDVNLYRYVWNNPYSFRDPYGNILLPQILLGAAAVCGGCKVVKFAWNYSWYAYYSWRYPEVGVKRACVLLIHRIEVKRIWKEWHKKLSIKEQEVLAD